MDYSNVIQRIRRSIAFVVTLDDNNRPSGTGTGFIYGKRGILVTCNHVVAHSSGCIIKFPDSDQLITVKTVLRDEEHDLALLKFEDDTRLPLEMEDESCIKEGVEVIFSGYPLSVQHLTTHQGILSAIAKDAVGTTMYLIDGTVNSGNSGCPLMTSSGKVIGVVNAKRQENASLLEKVQNMRFGALALHGVDIVEIYQALINNVQLGIGYAVPASYIPDYKEIK